MRERIQLYADILKLVIDLSMLLAKILAKLLVMSMYFTDGI